MSTVRRDRKLALITGGVLAVFATLLSAVSVAGWTIGSVEHTSHEVIEGPVNELRVDAGQGDVIVVPADGDDVTIDSRAEGSLRTPRLKTVVDGSDVSVTGGCPGVTFWHCGARIVVHVPRGTAVEVTAATGDVSATGIAAPVHLETRSGDVTASGLSGKAYLATHSGDVVTRELSGPAELRSTSGDVFGSGLGSGTVFAGTRSGDVVLRFATAPTVAEAEATSGDVLVTVPRGPATYRVEVDTASGDSEIGIPDTADAERSLSARTRSGDAVVTYGD